MAKELLPLCSIGKVTNRDGGVGPYGGRLFLPFFGYWYPTGQQLKADNTAAQIPQDQSMSMSGQVKPDVFTKTCCGTCG